MLAAGSQTWHKAAQPYSQALTSVLAKGDPSPARHPYCGERGQMSLSPTETSTATWLLRDIAVAAWLATWMVGQHRIGLLICGGNSSLEEMEEIRRELHILVPQY